jgi:HSP20 family molecular chaperone IbpA
MFKKNTCKNCKEKISTKYEFCPYCGTPVNSKKQNYGMLGRNDFIQNQENPFSMFRGMNNGLLDKMLGSAMKMLEKEMQREMSNKPKTNIRLMINGKEVKLNNNSQEKEPKKQIIQKKAQQRTLKNFTKLKQHEPKTNIRRLSDKVVYEIDLPEVKSIEDVSINQLENSIEIKAVTEDKAYSKIIQIALPIINYDLVKEKLILELGTKE